jgi:hypothetical protein
MLTANALSGNVIELESNRFGPNMTSERPPHRRTIERAMGAGVDVYAASYPSLWWYYSAGEVPVS